MQEVIFWKNYVSPKGRHLSCMTRTTLFGTDNKPEANRGIHKRVNAGYTAFRKVNTCAKRNPNNKGILAKQSAKLDAARRYTADIIETVKRTPTVVYSEGSYKMPGSMTL